MKIEIHTKRVEEDYVFLERGKRAFIHPMLKSVDYTDCKILYCRQEKIFVVDYKLVNGVYTKTLLTHSVEDIVNTLQEIE